MLYLRLLPLGAFYLCLMILALALTTLLIGITGDYVDMAPIVTFNTSSLGLADYHDAKSTLFTSINALVPSDVTHPPSITQFLGVADWYSMHYFTVCSGFFASSISNPSILTTNKVNMTCIRKFSGYTFSLHETLASTLDPSVQELLDDVSTKSYNTNTWISSWYTGLSNIFCSLVFLPFAFSGKCRRVNTKALVSLFISFLCFIITSSLITQHAGDINRTMGSLGPNPHPSTFLTLTWLTTVATVVAFCLVLQELIFENSTPYGERITTYYRRRTLSPSSGVDMKEIEVGRDSDQYSR